MQAAIDISQRILAILLSKRDGLLRLASAIIFVALEVL